MTAFPQPFKQSRRQARQANARKEAPPGPTSSSKGLNCRAEHEIEKSHGGRLARRASMLQVGGENDRKQMLHQMMHLIEVTHSREG